MKHIVPFLTTVAILGSVTSALGQPNTGPAPTALQIQTAKDHFDAGLRFYDHAEFRNDPNLYERAYLEFVRAWATYKTNTVLWNLALSAAHTHRTLEALGYFHEYDHRVHVLADSKHPDRKMFILYLDQLNAATAHVTVEADPGELVSLDGRPVGTSPLVDPLDLLPGRHAIKAGTQTADVDLAPGATYTAKLKTPFASTPSPTTTVLPSEQPAATAAPLAVLPASPSEVEQHADKTSISPRRLWLTVGLGAGSALLVTGAIIFGQKSADAGHDADAIRARTSPQSCPCADLDSSLQSARTNYVASTTLYVTGAAAATGALATWLFIRDEKKQTTAVPILAPGLVGAQWITRF